MARFISLMTIILCLAACSRSDGGLSRFSYTEINKEPLAELWFHTDCIHGNCNLFLEPIEFYGLEYTGNNLAYMVERMQESSSNGVVDWSSYRVNFWNENRDTVLLELFFSYENISDSISEWVDGVMRLPISVHDERVELLFDEKSFPLDLYEDRNENMHLLLHLDAPNL